MDRQRNDLPSTTSVTVHVVAGSLGWRILTVAPGASGPSISTLVIDAVHSGQRVTSDRTAHTTSGGAGMTVRTSVCTPLL